MAGGEFAVNLTSVLEAASCLLPPSAGSSQLNLSYDRGEAVLKMEFLQHDLAAGSILSTCALPGLAPADEDDEDEEGGKSLALLFRKTEVTARAIASSEYLRPAVGELAEVAGATCCTLGISPKGVTMGCVGNAMGGDCLVELGKEGFVSLECHADLDVEKHEWTYPLHLMLQGMRGLEVARETCVSLNQNGMIAIQHQVVDNAVGDGEPNFVDFIMGPIADDPHHDIHDQREESPSVVSTRTPSQTIVASRTPSQTFVASPDSASSRDSRFSRARPNPAPIQLTPPRKRRRDVDLTSRVRAASDSEETPEKEFTVSPEPLEDSVPSSPELYFGDTRLDDRSLRANTASKKGKGKKEYCTDDDTDEDEFY